MSVSAIVLVSIQAPEYGSVPPSQHPYGVPVSSKYESTYPQPSYAQPKETTPLAYSTASYGGGVGYGNDAAGYYQQTPQDVRADFLRKVYGILSAQIGLAALICLGVMFQSNTRNFLLANVWIIWVFFAVSLILLIALFYQARSYPLNLILLFSFTAVLGLEVSMVCSAYAANGMILSVAAAFGMTLIVFVSLTIFVSVSKIDFDFLGPFLFVGLIVLMIWGLISMFTGFHARFAYAAFGTLLFSGYIIYDTHQVMERLGCDDYVLGAVTLFLDIFNLFLMILELMGGGGRR